MTNRLVSRTLRLDVWQFKQDWVVRLRRLWRRLSEESGVVGTRSRLTACCAYLGLIVVDMVGFQHGLPYPLLGVQLNISFS